MGRLYTCGFEFASTSTAAEDTTSTSNTSTTRTIESASPISGDHSLKIVGTNTAVAFGYDRFNIAGSSARTFYARMRIHIPSVIAPDHSVGVLAFFNSTTQLMAIRYEQSTGTLQCRSAGLGGTQWGSDSPVVPLDQDFVVELALNIGTGSVDYVEARLDGVSFVNLTGQNITDSQPDHVRFGLPLTLGSPNQLGTGLGFIYDDLAVNDDQGADQNGFPGLGRVVALRPSTQGSNVGWNLGDNTAPAGNDTATATQSHPPTGLATPTSAGNKLHQVGDNSSTAIGASGRLELVTETYDAKCGSGATIVLVQEALSIACSSTTSTTGGMRIASNPAEGSDTTITYSAGIAGAWPTGWTRVSGPVNYSPSVTPGSGATLRFEKTTATTRTTVVSGAALIVEYTPAVTIIAPAAQSNASAPTPAITGTAVSDAATATAVASQPTTEVKVAAPAASATADTTAPTIEVKPAPSTASATASAPVPTIGHDVAPDAALATATAPAPTLPSGAVDVTLSVGAAQANASAPVPAASLTIAISTGLTTATAPTPTLDPYTLSPTTGTATASAPIPVPKLTLEPPATRANAFANDLVLDIGGLQAPAAHATASAPAPALISVNKLLKPAAARATARGVVPVFTPRDKTLLPPTAKATARGNLPPFVPANKTLAPPAAKATARGNVPLRGPVTIPPAASATARGNVPTLIKTFVVPTASAVASGVATHPPQPPPAVATARGVAPTLQTTPAPPTAQVTAVANVPVVTVTPSNGPVIEILSVDCTVCGPLVIEVDVNEPIESGYVQLDDGRVIPLSLEQIA